MSVYTAPTDPAAQPNNKVVASAAAILAKALVAPS
jgi:hypothetical protein